MNQNNPNSSGGSTPDPVETLAALYAAGELDAAASDAFEARLLAGDAEAIRAFEAVRPVRDALLRSAKPVEPGLITRSNLINRLGLAKPAAPFTESQPAADPFAEDPKAMVILRAADVDWKPTPVPGVMARNLFVDRDANRVSVLLKLAPGVVYPDHDHLGVEECLVLEGDLELGGKTLLSGDYIRIPKGGQHGTPRTTAGCLLLVVTTLSEAA